MKTLVIATHEHGPMRNGDGGCHARWGHGGLCPGHALAAWLNGLGDDNETYCGRFTNGDVRMNWIRGNAHIEAVDRRLADLHSERRRYHASLAIVNREIRRIEKSQREAGTRNHVDA